MHWSWYKISAPAAALLLASACSTPRPAPVSAAAAPAPSCPAASVTLYFEPGSAEVTSIGRQIVRTIADQLKGCPVHELQILGLADPQGTPEANLELSKQRAEAVRDAFLGAGLPVQRFTIMAAGDAGSVRPSGAVEPLRRRVDVIPVIAR